MSWNLVLFLFLSLGGSQIEWGTVKIAAGDDYFLTRSERENILRNDLRKLAEEKEEAAERARRPDGQPSYQGVQRFLANSLGTRMCGSTFDIQWQAIRLHRNQGSRPGTSYPPLTIHSAPVDPHASADSTAAIHGECPFAQDTSASRAVCTTLNPRFRTFNGVCNNLWRPVEGSSFTPFVRLLPPDYADDFNNPRRATGGGELPSARDVSRAFFPATAAQKLSNVFTFLLMSLGQILDHDLTRTALTSLCGDNDEEREVECGSDGCETGGGELEACFPILVDQNDPDFKPRPCLMFVRTQGVPQRDCAVGPRQQLNVLTHYIDASNVYGSTKAEADALRDPNPKRGRLLVMPNRKPSCRPLLPLDPDIDDCVEDKCFTAGDGRVNENVALSVIHTIFVRNHNLIERQLFRKYGKIWDGERLFQETRRIFGAFWQQFVYNEYLPAILGPHVINDPRFSLKLKEWGYSKAYDKTVSAELPNVFAAAVFRYSHSMIADILTFNTNKFDNVESIPLSTTLQRPGEAFNNDRPGGCGIDSIAFGILSQQNRVVDKCFSREITVNLFSEDPPNVPGLDLVALNIQRGRDQGVPGYTAWRGFCHLTVPADFDEFEDIFGQAVTDIFRGLYDEVDDVDIFAAGMAEPPADGSLLGETFTCIMGIVFTNLRIGDRFFFDNGCQKGFFRDTQFTRAQLREIRRVTLSRLICNALDDVKTIQPWSLLLPWAEVPKSVRNDMTPSKVVYYSNLYRQSSNKRVRCSRIPDIDFTVF